MINGNIPILSKNFRKRWIVKKELTADKKIVTIKLNKSMLLPSCTKFIASYDAAAIIMGTDIKNENLTAELRSSPNKRPVVIVMPERDVPGINANICENPIINASFLFIELIPRYLLPKISDNHNNSPKKIVVNDIIKG